MLVNSTSVFRESLNKLCKQPKHKYKTCPKDICDEIRSKTEIELINNNDQISNNAHSSLIKMRVANSGRKEGQSGGFRVIALVSKIKSEISLLEVYPKTGRYGQPTINDDDLEYILEVFVKERDNKTLEEHDAAKRLKLKREVEKASTQ